MKTVPIRIAILDDFTDAANKRKCIIEDRFRSLPNRIEVRTFQFVEDFLAEVENGRFYDVIVSDLFMSSKGPPRSSHTSAEDGGLKIFEWLRGKRERDGDFVRVQLLWVSTQRAVNQVASRLKGKSRSWFNWIEDSSSSDYFASQVEGMIQTATSRFIDLYLPDGFKSKSLAMGPVMAKAARVAGSKSVSILLTGETGVGKDHLARRIAAESKLLPFVACNCASIPEALLESELFGHVKGSFTGATEDQIGLFELAHCGTLFLDEIGDMPLAQQAKVLRAIENKEVRRVGGRENRPADFRLISATHRNLKELIEDGGFREDLLSRIGTTEICVPPLRERREEIDEIAGEFLRAFGGDSPPVLSEAVREVFLDYPWPKNIRELQNQVKVAIALAGGQCTILVEHLDGDVRAFAEGKLPDSMPTKEEEAIGVMLRTYDGNKRKCAAALALPLRTLYDKIKKSEYLKRLCARIRKNG